MKIVLVSPLLDLGGGQRYVTELANQWASTGLDVSIIVLRDGDIFYNISDKVKIIKLNFHNSGKISKLFNGVRTVIRLRNEIKRIQPNFVLSILSTTNILTLFSTMSLKTKVYIRDTFSPTRKKNFIEKTSRKLLYKKADGIIAQTMEIKNSTENETGCKNIKVIRNPVRKINGREMFRKEKIILNVGALIPRKGQKYFIDACAKINAPGWKFVILGEGKYRNQLEDRIKKLDLQDKIELVGAVNNVDEWLLRSSVFVFPSLLEGLPNALIEAMTAGLACISFDCETGPRDLIKDNVNGFLVPVGDSDLLVSKMEQLINDIELREKISNEAVKIYETLKVEKIANEVLNFCTETN